MILRYKSTVVFSTLTELCDKGLTDVYLIVKSEKNKIGDNKHV